MLLKKLEKACFGKDYKMKIVIQTKETGVSRLFGLETEITILKSLELQTKELLRNNKENLVEVF
jgi:site-specific DNA-methyltransferase (adenine-specific)